MLPRLLFRTLRPTAASLLRPSAAFSTSASVAAPTTVETPAATSTPPPPSPPPPPPPPQQQQQQQPKTEPVPAASASASASPSSTNPIPHDSLRLLPLLRSQPQHYITIHIHRFPFLVTAGDIITLPFRLKGVAVGQTLRLTHASVLGSRDYTLKGNPWIDGRLFRCRATVVEETAEPLRIKEKTKRRQRRVKTVKSKHPYTVLRIKEVAVRDPDELGDGGQQQLA